MRSWSVGFVSFFAGAAVGGFLLAQQTPAPGMQLNHVGIFAKDFDATMKYYTQVVGLREAFTVKNDDGTPRLAYLQINKNQFIEIAPAGTRPVGLSHVGIVPDNLARTVAALRSKGATLPDPATGATLTTITNNVDPDGIRLEFLDFLPGSLPRKAIDEWK